MTPSRPSGPTPADPQTKKSEPSDRGGDDSAAPSADRKPEISPNTPVPGPVDN